MSEQIRLIGQRIKEIREIRGFSISEASRLLEIPKEEYSEYEIGSKDIPIGFLYKLSKEFKVDLTEILTGQSPRLKTFMLVRKGEGKDVERMNCYDYKSLAYNFANKKAEPFIVLVKPKEGEIVSQNSHDGQEFNYLLEGRLEIVIDGHHMVLNKGDSIYFDSSKKHGMKALDNRKAVFLAIIL